MTGSHIFQGSLKDVKKGVKKSNNSIKKIKSKKDIELAKPSSCSTINNNKFIQILFHMVTYPKDHRSIFTWDAENKCIIWKYRNDISDILQKYFKHENKKSFERQLHLYKFELIKFKNEILLKHENFTKYGFNQNIIFKRKRITNNTYRQVDINHVNSILTDAQKIQRDTIEQIRELNKLINVLKPLTDMIILNLYQMNPPKKQTEGIVPGSPIMIEPVYTNEDDCIKQLLNCSDITII